MHRSATVIQPVADLMRGPSGPRDRQLLYGDAITVLGQTNGYCLVRAEKDGYCGTLSQEAIGAAYNSTHKVSVRQTHVYEAADIKSPDLAHLSHGSSIKALGQTDKFVQSQLGFIPIRHLVPNDHFEVDPAAVAGLFLGTPYLWGGNSHLGIDCSGLIQAALLACNHPCPGDSDQQAEALGETLASPDMLRRNDLVFWKGHVALVCDDKTLIHANAAHMAVSLEKTASAIARIEAQGDGSPVAFKRLSFFDP